MTENEDVGAAFSSPPPPPPPPLPLVALAPRRITTNPPDFASPPLGAALSRSASLPRLLLPNGHKDVLPVPPTGPVAPELPSSCESPLPPPPRPNQNNRLGGSELAGESSSSTAMRGGGSALGASGTGPAASSITAVWDLVRVCLELAVPAAIVSGGRAPGGRWICEDNGDGLAGARIANGES